MGLLEIDIGNDDKIQIPDSAAPSLTEIVHSIRSIYDIFWRAGSIKYVIPVKIAGQEMWIKFKSEIDYDSVGRFWYSQMVIKHNNIYKFTITVAKNYFDVCATINGEYNENLPIYWQAHTNAAHLALNAEFMTKMTKLAINSAYYNHPRSPGELGILRVIMRYVGL